MSARVIERFRLRHHLYVRLRQRTRTHAGGILLVITTPSFLLPTSPNDEKGGSVAQEEKERSQKVVCVTGGSGYIASWLVKLLLQRGFIVRASVRDPSDPKKTEHLRALDGASERLQLFKADLLEKGSFDNAIAGCVGVFHTASPCFYNATDFQRSEDLPKKASVSL